MVVWDKCLGAKVMVTVISTIVSLQKVAQRVGRKRQGMIGGAPSLYLLVQRSLAIKLHATRLVKGGYVSALTF